MPESDQVQLLAAPQALVVPGRRGIGGHTRPNHGLSDEWLTPPDLLLGLGPFDLDPCATCDQAGEARPWRTAKRMLCMCDDGLRSDWEGRVWLNPPYSLAADFLTAMAYHRNGIALIFARTETAMFHELIWQVALGILFLEGRLYFHKPDGTRARGNAGGPSCLVAYTDADVEALRASGLPGALVTDWKENSTRG